jgi:hypothetical protein
MRWLVIVALVIGACGKDDGKGGRKHDDDDDDPGLFGYAKRSKASEGELQIDNLQNQSRKYFYGHNNAFPIMKIGLTPATPCCEEATQHMCQPVAADWIGTDWEQLHFKMIDRPYRFQYSYESDGQTVIITATADLDCDPTNGETKVVAHGKVVAGEPEFDVETTKEQ